MSVVLIRGLPGAGKTTLANKIPGTDLVVSADDFFDTPDGYVFVPEKVRESHEWCQSTVEEAVKKGQKVVVANTFTKTWELEPYTERYEGFKILDLFDGGLTDEQLFERNVHGVPLMSIRAMRARWEPLLPGTMVSADSYIVGNYVTTSGFVSGDLREVRNSSGAISVVSANRLFCMVYEYALSLIK